MPFLDGLQQIEKLFRVPADFIWYTSKRPIPRMNNKTIVNKFASSYFTSKVIWFSNVYIAYCKVYFNFKLAKYLDWYV